MNSRWKNYVEFDTPYGPAYVVYKEPPPYSDNGKMHVVQTVVQCPDHIVWDDTTGKWYPEPQVVDYVLPRARAVCEILGVPRYEWLDEVRRGEIWAIEREFEMGRPISSMMEYTQ